MQISDKDRLDFVEKYYIRIGFKIKNKKTEWIARLIADENSHNDFYGNSPREAIDKMIILKEEEKIYGR